MLFVFRGDWLIAFLMCHIMGETRFSLKVLSRDRICINATDSGSLRCVFPQFKLHGLPPTPGGGETCDAGAKRIRLPLLLGILMILTI